MADRQEQELENPFFDYNHMKITAMEPDYAAAELTVVEESCNVYGRVHGGAFCTLGDNTAGYAACSNGKLYVTQTATMHFIGNVEAGHQVRAEARVRHRGRTTCLVDVDFRDENSRLLSMGTYTFFCIEGR